MCGIAGYIDFNKQAEESILRKMTDCLSHRGPDASGYFFEAIAGYHIGLGHRRLSIIDLSPSGHQPMFTEDKQACIIFNGEIYNYAEIRQKLISKGHLFVSGSDTEVILKAYLEWGEHSLNEFIGMFAFVIYDRKKDRLFIARDRAGVKPLYYYWKNNQFLFASELKSFFEYPDFIKKIDQQSALEFFRYGNVPAPYSIFSDTWKLEPGHYLVVDMKSKVVSTSQYWNVLDYYKQDKLVISESSAKEELKQRLKKACAYRMVSDVPVGLFLSGGYDSSLVAAILQSESTEKIKTFTIGFPEAAYNEAGYAKQVADHLGTDHHELYCTYDEAKSIIPQLPYYYDEPFGDSSAIPTILVSRFARQSVTVALSADGGDELMAGYQRHISLLSLAGRVNRIPSTLRKTLAFAMRNSPEALLRLAAKGKYSTKENIAKYASYINGDIGLMEMIDLANQTAFPGEIQKLFQGEATERELFNRKQIRQLPTPLDQLLAFDYLCYLPGDILTKVDRATMSVSLEGREPLLDQHLVEWTARLPDAYKLSEGATSKYLFHQIVHDYIPRSVMERPKMGFTVPLKEWFRKDLRYLFEEHLDERSLRQHGLLNSKQLGIELKQYYEGQDFRFPLLWNALMFQLWYEKWM
jgi:asparagine synthase (glutamine-hydrolysing)